MYIYGTAITNVAKPSRIPIYGIIMNQTLKPTKITLQSHANLLTAFKSFFLCVVD